MARPLAVGPMSFVLWFIFGGAIWLACRAMGIERYYDVAGVIVCGVLALGELNNPRTASWWLILVYIILMLSFASSYRDDKARETGR
jgi:hypothetical protein